MTTKTTAHLSRGRRQRLRRFLRRHDPWLLIGLALLTLPLLSAGVQALISSFSGPYQPIIIMATPRLPTPPTTTPTIPSPPMATPALQVTSTSALRLSRAVIAYSAPLADAAIGAVEPGRIYTPTGR